MIFAIIAWCCGICIGFAWGCDCGLRRPAWARGFVAGFNAPWRWLAQQAKEE